MLLISYMIFGVQGQGKETRHRHVIQAAESAAKNMSTNESRAEFESKLAASFPPQMDGVTVNEFNGTVQMFEFRVTYGYRGYRTADAGPKRTFETLHIKCTDGTCSII